MNTASPAFHSLHPPLLAPLFVSMLNMAVHRMVSDFIKTSSKRLSEICKFSDVNEKKERIMKTVIIFNLCTLNYNFIVSSVFFAVEAGEQTWQEEVFASHIWTT